MFYLSRRGRCAIEGRAAGSLGDRGGVAHSPPRSALPREAPIGPTVSNISLTRDGVVKAFGLSDELFEALQEAGVLKAEDDGSFDLAGVAANLFNYGMANARAANQRLLAAASALNETLPALQRLSELPDHAELDGPVREKVTRELAAFFEVFSKALGRATQTLQSTD